MNKVHKYTKEEFDFLSQYSYKMRNKELTDLFNKTFNTSLNPCAISKIINTYHLNPYAFKWKKLSQEQLDFIKNNYLSYTYKDLAIMYNNKFGTTLKSDSIKRICYRHNFLRDKSTFYRHINRHKIGTLVRWGNGWYIKTDDKIYKKNVKVYLKPNYRRYADYLYEKYQNVKINDITQMVIHLDNDINNFDKDNLLLVEKSVAKRYFARRGTSLSIKDWNMALINLCKLIEKNNELERVF